MALGLDSSSLIPHDAWDTHIHVFEPEKHPYSSERAYTPARAPFEDYPQKATGCNNILVVQASVQGNSPSPLIDLLTRVGRDNTEFGGLCRGLTMLDLEHTTTQELDQLHKVGIRGIRMNEVSWGFGHQTTNDAIAQKLQSATKRLARFGWVIDLWMHPRAWAALAPVIDALPESVKIIADHWAGFQPGQENSAEFQIFLNLLRRRRVYVKLSAFERQYNDVPNGILSLEPMARAIIEAGPDRLLFGSDWPNTALASSREGKSREQRLEDVENHRQVDHALHIKQLRYWIQDDNLWRKLWVDTPNSLFR